MILGSLRGLKTPRWIVNEIWHIEELEHMLRSTYDNFVDAASLFTVKRDGVADDKNYAQYGLKLVWQSGMSCNLETGIAFSTFGYYDDSFTFVDSAGYAFAVLVDVATAVAFDTGDALARHDTLEIRPKRDAYDTKTRQVIDPVTKVVSDQAVATKYDFTFESQVLKGTPGAGVAPATTSGWIKIAEIYVDALASVIDQDDVLDIRDSSLWTTNSEITVYPKIDSDDIEASAIDSAHINWGMGAGQAHGTEALPVGTIWMFDANRSGGGGSPGGASGAWVDNGTIPNWYAMVAANSVHGCQDMVDRFVMGKVVAGAGSTGGSNSKTIASANLPIHTHAIDHNHGVTTSGSGSSHTHGAGTYLAATDGYHSHDCNRDTNASTGVTGEFGGADGVGLADLHTQSTGNHTHDITGTSGAESAHTHSVDLPNFSGSSGNGGFANTALDVTPAQYAMIYIRKCA